MTTVVVLPSNRDSKNFRAVSGKKQSFGETIGEALDALNEQLEAGERNTVVYVQDFRPDEFFTAGQQERLSELMQKWRDARDNKGRFSTEEQSELENLIGLELEGSGKRAGKIADELKR